MKIRTKKNINKNIINNLKNPVTMYLVDEDMNNGINLEEACINQARNVIKYWQGDKTGNESNYNFGIVAEKLVGDFFKNDGYKVYQSKGSRSPVDLICYKDGRVVLIQVKSSRTNKKPYISDKHIQDLKKIIETIKPEQINQAELMALIALVNSNGIEIINVETGEKMNIEPEYKNLELE